MATGNRWLVLAIVSSALFLIVVDMTVLYTALPRLTHDLAASASQKLWIVNAYPLVVAGLLPGLGTLGDRLGHRSLFLAGLVVFGIASLSAAYSPTPEALIGSRVLLAVGAAMMMPATLSIIRLTFTEDDERSFAIGIWAAVASGGAAFGPVIGGVMLEYFWWGSVFLINVPVVAAARTMPSGIAYRVMSFPPEDHCRCGENIVADATMSSFPGRLLRQQRISADFTRMSFDLDTFLPYRLSVAANQVSRRFAARYAAEAGLSIPEWRVLAHLSRSGAVSVRDITARVNLDKSIVDEILLVPGDEAIAFARRAAAEEGIITGISGGGALQAAGQVVARPEFAGKTIVVVIADTGERYLSTALFEGLLD